MKRLSLWDASGRAKITGANLFSGITQTITGLTPGKTYVYKATVETTTTNQNIRLQIAGIGLINASGEASGGAGTYELWDTFTATGSTHILEVHPYGANHASTYYVDNVEFRLADPDRSVNANGLIVNGTIAKTPVATGADLVAYSNFSSSNYLEQPYNPDLNFGAYTGTAGTGDFCVMGWVKAAELYDTIFTRSDGATTTTEIIWQIGATPDSYRYYIGGTQINTGPFGFSTGWNFHALVRRSGTVYSYVNGTLKHTAVAAGSVTQSGAKLIVGNSAFVAATIGADQFTGSLALFRISATAPTADQIRKIYEDEKVLFQDSAKATLTGSSDAVTALAHDPDTDLLHVSTSGGRSVFQGLRRVEEHTGTDSQSLAAISAVDGLVVEGK